jgi:hypothetical protein
VPLRTYEEAALAERVPERRLEREELGVGRAARGGGYTGGGRRDRLQERPAELVGVHHERLREVQRGLRRAGGDRRQVVTAEHLRVREAAPLVAEDDRGPSLRRPRPGLARDLVGREAALAADLPRARPDDPRAVRDRVVERPDHPRAVEELLGVDRDAAGGREVVRAQLGDGPVVEAEVLHRPGHRAEVLRVPGPEEHDADREAARGHGRSVRRVCVRLARVWLARLRLAPQGGVP